MNVIARIAEIKSNNLNIISCSPFKVDKQNKGVILTFNYKSGKNYIGAASENIVQFLFKTKVIKDGFPDLCRLGYFYEVKASVSRAPFKVCDQQFEKYRVNINKLKLLASVKFFPPHLGQLIFDLCSLNILLISSSVIFSSAKIPLSSNK